MKDNQEKNENVDSSRPQVFSKLDEEGLQSKYVWTTRTGIYESKKKINEYIEQNSDISKFNSKEAIATFLENSPEDDEHGQLFIIFQTIATQIVENEENISKIKENFPELKSISDSSKFIAKFAIIMCEVAKIDCKVIDGFIKHYNYEKDENELKPHTWNKVQIKGIPYLVDFFLGGTFEVSDGKHTQTLRKFDPSWYLTPPYIFIYTHLPEKSEDQILSTSVTQDEFLTLPIINASFFKNENKMEKDETMKVIQTNNHFVKEISYTKLNHGLVAKLLKFEGLVEVPNSTLVLIDEPKRKYEIHVSAPNGKYRFEVYEDEEAERIRKTMVEFTIEIASVENNALELCSNNLKQSPIYLFEPLYKKLVLGQSTKFQLRVKAKNVILRAEVEKPEEVKEPEVVEEPKKPEKKKEGEEGEEEEEVPDEEKEKEEEEKKKKKKKKEVEVKIIEKADEPAKTEIIETNFIKENNRTNIWELTDPIQKPGYYSITILYEDKEEKAYQYAFEYTTY